MQNQERQLPIVGNRVYFDNQEEPAQSGWYLLHRVRNVSGSIDSPDALVTLCRENNEPGDYLSALASEISLTGPQTAPRVPAEEWPYSATVKLRHSFSRDIGWAKRDVEGRLVSAYSQLPLDQSQWFVLEERKPTDADLRIPGADRSSLKVPAETSPTANEPEVEIRKVLVLSTGHLTKRTCLEFKSWPFIANFEEGCYFYVGEEPESYTDAPEDLRGVLAFAKRHGCTEVKFDQDADQIPQLPFFEW